MRKTVNFLFAPLIGIAASAALLPVSPLWAQGADTPATTQAPAATQAPAVTQAPSTSPSTSGSAAAPAAPSPSADAAPAPAPSTTAAPPSTAPAQAPRQRAQKPRQAAPASPKTTIKEPVTSSGCRAVAQPGKPYFVEFRSRTAASYGHTFVFHGKIGSGKGFASFKVAGLHPKGDDPAVYIQGHWIPVPAETGVSNGDLDEQYLTARFCVPLTEAEYRKAEAYIIKLQATKKTWHATTYNCNVFAADIAREIGLDTPNPNMHLPEAFIKRMAELNKAAVASSAPLANSAANRKPPQ